MEWRVGIIPRPTVYIEKPRPGAFCRAVTGEILREKLAAEREEAERARAARAQAADKALLARLSAAMKPPARPRASRAATQASSEMAALRMSLTRKLALVLDRYRECPERVCHRSRRCASPALRCLEIAHDKPMTQERADAALAGLLRAIHRARGL